MGVPEWAAEAALPEAQEQCGRDPQRTAWAELQNTIRPHHLQSSQAPVVSEEVREARSRELCWEPEVEDRECYHSGKDRNHHHQVRDREVLQEAQAAALWVHPWRVLLRAQEEVEERILARCHGMEAVEIGYQCCRPSSVLLRVYQLLKRLCVWHWTRCRYRNLPHIRSLAHDLQLASQWYGLQLVVEEAAEHEAM